MNLHNEEQLEAATASLKTYLDKMQRAQGWVDGRDIECRRDRIKRIRRWRRIEEVYPDRIKEWADNAILTGGELVLSKKFDGFEIMITSANRKVHPKLDAPEWVWADVGSWDEIKQYNGYCRFMSKPVIEEGYHGILSYVPVHGGITFAHFDKGVATYGFDTGHADDENNPLVRNLEWVEFQAWLMAKAIRLAAQFEPAYLRSECVYHRASVVDRYHAKVRKLTQQPFVLGNNFGAMINLLCGRV